MLNKWKALSEAIADLPDAMERSMNRFAEEQLTRKYLFRDARKIKNTPISGDAIAKIIRS